MRTSKKAGPLTRLLARLRWRRKRKAEKASPTWQDNMPSWVSRAGLGRYLHIPEIDRWRAVPFDMPPTPERGTVLQRVRQLTESLQGAVDEGTGAALDPLIESWVGSWIATVDTEYTDHCGVIQVHRGQALEWLTESTRTAEQARDDFDHARADYLACRQRLTGETAVGDPDGQAVPAEEGGGPARAGAGPARGQAGRADAPVRAGWTAPHLVAGRSTVAQAATAILIMAGALTDTLAFKNILELVLKHESENVSWLMAAGATAMALVAAGSLGVALAIHRRGLHGGSRLALTGSAAVWFGLGLAMFLVRWRSQSAAPQFGTIPAAASGSSLWLAVFFAAIYLISGACTLFEAERLYNPEYFAFLRLGRQYRASAARLATCDAAAARAREALDLHDGELDREEQRRVAAIAERKALGAEAANYARILMAQLMGDPAKTPVTETGPVPEMPAPGEDTADAA